MPRVIGIRFKSCGKIYDFEVDGLEVTKGDRVIVESEFGLSIGQVITGPTSMEEPEKELKKVLRVATEDDLRQKQDNENFERNARSFCLERIMARGLPMKLVCSEVTLDRKRIVFYFTADGRIDFRELVKDLAAKFKTRIEMRQIGVRDKAKMVGGLGLCGKELCCKLFLTSFEPISIKMAKQQELVLNTGKLSGICGRLMCCLGYEYNEGSEGTSGRTDERKVSTVEETVADLSEESLVGAEVACCTESQPPEVPSSQPAKQDDKKKSEGFRKQRRRRRYRKKATKNE
ncbi:MAG TPA: stage 0 sporulation family protein [Candidatus Sulfobium mesophilum]|nr:stage 0 sporulation family protein [Candidatus Sulfobium mesophilum]